MAEQLETAAFGSDKGGVGKSLAASLRISKHFLDTGKLPVIVTGKSPARIASMATASGSSASTAGRGRPRHWR